MWYCDAGDHCCTCQSVTNTPCNSLQTCNICNQVSVSHQLQLCSSMSQEDAVQHLSLGRSADRALAGLPTDARCLRGAARPGCSKLPLLLSFCSCAVCAWILPPCCPPPPPVTAMRHFGGAKHGYALSTTLWFRSAEDLKAEH